MASTLSGFRCLFSFIVVWCVVVALMLALAAPGQAGDGAVVHVGQTTEMVLDGKGWSLDKSASRKANLVSVQIGQGGGASQRIAVRGLKTGQVELVFRRGAERVRASIDVLN